MGLLGSGANVIWYDVSAEAEHDEWHSHEHLMERVSIPGFLRGRRGVAVSGSPRHFILYETRDLAVLTSQSYLEFLNHPTSLTKSVMRSIQNMTRTLCKVTASFGTGVGMQLLTIQLTPAAGHSEMLRHWLVTEVLPELVKQRGFITASLVEGDKAASRTKGVEKSLSGQAVEIADWTVMVDGYDIDAIRKASANLLSPASLIKHGASDNQITAMYQLAHIISDCDLQTPSLEPSRSM